MLRVIAGEFSCSRLPDIEAAKQPDITRPSSSSVILIASLSNMF